MIPEKISSLVSLNRYISTIEELNNLHDYRLRSDLTDEWKASISRYENDSTDINAYLRKWSDAVLFRDVEEVVTDISHIDSAQASPLSFIKEDLLLFRGISSDFGRYLLEIEQFKERAFLSTSYSLYDAARYAHEAERLNPEKDGVTYIIVIELKRGKRGIILVRDHEILLPRESKWVIAEAKEFESLTLNEESEGGLSTLFIPRAIILYLRSQ